MKFIPLLLLFTTFICLENVITSINLDEALTLKTLYSRLKEKMEMIDKNIKLNKIKKGNTFNLQMESKAATTTAPKTLPNLRSSSFILNNILKSSLGSKLTV
uniref:Uncharacterized protein n=1 Tax=Strongyloides stercoralis TaxID=6248 RepID=A0A0K0EG55_STRER